MPDYHPSDRVLAIAEAMHDADNYFVSYDQARAAMNLALEEAAKVCDEREFANLYGIKECAAAIRDLKE